MKALASFVMRGWSQATGVAVLFALLSLVLPPLSVLSGAVVALVALRNGADAGLRVLVAATVAMAVALYALVGQPMVALLVPLLLWVPMLILALVLRYTRSLAAGVLTALAFGALIVVTHLIVLDDPAREWTELLGEQVGEVLKAQGLDEAASGQVLAAMGRWMTGALAAAYFLQIAASLFLARWWQALLYNPGGFGAEFRALRLPRWLAGVAVPLVAALFVDGLPDALRYLALPAVAAFFLQGLALAHSQLAAFNAGPGWLVGIYALLVVATPYAFTALATAGYADAWMDFRARKAKPPGEGDGT